MLKIAPRSTALNRNKETSFFARNNRNAIVAGRYVHELLMLMEDYSLNQLTEYVMHMCYNRQLNLSNCKLIMKLTPFKGKSREI